MTRRGFPQYAKLWQEQIGQEELTQFQAMAKTIERTAKRRGWIDTSLWFLAFGLVCVVLWINTTSLGVKLGFGLLVAGTTWFGWRRHEITKASKALAVDDPRLFFEAAIRNVRAEIGLSSISLWLGPPFLIISILLTNAAEGGDSIDFVFRKLRYENLARTIAIAVFVILFLIYFVRDNMKLRKQLRRFESMSREWDDQTARDLREGP